MSGEPVYFGANSYPSTTAATGTPFISVRETNPAIDGRSCIHDIRYLQSLSQKAQLLEREAQAQGMTVSRLRQMTQQDKTDLGGLLLELDRQEQAVKNSRVQI